MKNAGFSQWKHVQGEVSALQKLDRHYNDLFGFLASKEDSIIQASINPKLALKIHRALRWFKQNNCLYRSNYETLFRYVKPGFANPELLEHREISQEELLEDEAVGIAFPVDAQPVSIDFC